MESVIKKNGGVSILFAVIYLAIGAVLVVSMLRATLEVQKRMSGSAKSLESEDVAEGALKTGLAEMAKHGPGYEKSGVYEVNLDRNIKLQQGQVERKSNGNWWIFSRPDKVFGGNVFPDFYSVPNIGTGDAGTGCVSADMAPDRVADAAGSFQNDPDNPCNWNKLTLDAPAVIPLYYTDFVNGADSAVNPWSGQPGPEFKLRIRTPCTANAGGAGAACAAGGRYEFNILDDDKTIVNWEILAKCAGYPGGRCSLLANTSREKNTNNRTVDNTEISEDRIKTNGDNLNYVVLSHEEQFSKGWINGDEIGTFRLNLRNPIQDFLKGKNEPVLQLTLLHGLTDAQNNQIPYLEYQVLVKDIATKVGIENRTTAGITDAYTIVKSSGKSGDYFKRFSKKVKQKGAKSGFVLQ